MKSLAASLTLIILCAVGLLAQPNNPVPFVNQPLVPASVAPGGAGFALTVNGTGFVSGSVVNWNGSARTTTFVSSSQLTASILSSDIATAGTASITVTSPAPGGGPSNIVFLSVRESSTFVSLSQTDFSVQGSGSTCSLAAGDFNNDGTQDLAVCLYLGNSQYTLSILLGNGNGTFSQGAQYSVAAYSIVAADINGDGNLDLVFDSIPSGNVVLAVMLGNGNGTFQPIAYYQASNISCCGEVGVGDFNRDGLTDVATTNAGSFCIFLGVGGGAFQAGRCYNLPQPGNFFWLTAGDFNRDGILDLALASYGTNGGVAVALGNGDGTFGTPVLYPFAGGADSITSADVNGDGTLDLEMVDGVAGRSVIAYGNGDGTFRPGPTYSTAFEPLSASIADMNGDGNLDLIVPGYGYNIATASILLGNGDGTFQPFSEYDAGAEGYLAIADFNNDGRLDLATANTTTTTITILTQDNGTTASISPKNEAFPTQLVNTVSNPKLMLLTNTGTSPITVSNISLSADFSELTNCSTVQPAHTCVIGIFFTPTTPGNIIGYMAVTDNAGGSPQVLNLSGTGTVVSLSPSSVNFGSWPVGSYSSPQTVTVTNKGNGPLTISGIGIGGTNPGSFDEVNACPQQLPAATSCNITVYFHPGGTGVRNAGVGVEDSGGGSPQTVPLTGTGT